MSERDIFNAALAIDDPAQRAAYLDRACAGDPRLREHLDGLLQMHGQVGSFLEAPALTVAATVDDPIGERPGTAIGPYKLLEQIGEGGFGVVFMAEQQQPVRRKVALKVLKPGMDTRQVVARFEAERQALALMDHPNIAHVFDGGETASGRPYFVMELVRGIPITDFCDQSLLPVRERLELFVSVCQAVQHAHQKGIIHRDLKPSNVLVTLHDDRAVVKVIDFGIAKATGQQLTDKTLFTNFAQMIGTPLYMSPEQAQMSGLDVDTRSDVYSLGVLLYELLTGTTPFDKERLRTVGYDEMRRIIREEEPARPSTRLSTLGPAAGTVSANRKSDPGRLRQLFRGELDWIVMKALEKDRNRRYESASAFAADVQRYLHDEQVLACPPSAWYRFRKFARRNKAGVLAATSVALGVLLAVAGLVGALLVLAASNTQIQEKQEQTSEALHRERETSEKLAQARAGAVADAYRALLGETRTLRLTRPSGWRETALGNLRRLAAMETPERDLAELRTEAVACLAEMDAREVLRLEGHTELVYGLDFSPDGKTLASAGSDGRLFLWDRDEGQVVRQVADRAVKGKFWTPEAPLPVVRFRPGGGYLAYTTWSRRVEFLGWGEHPAAPAPLQGTAQPRDLAFDRKGKLLAVSWGDGRVGLYDAATGAPRRLVTSEPPGLWFYTPVALSPAGDLLATRGLGDIVQLHAVADGGKPRVLGRHGGAVRGLAFSPDGDRLVSASEDGTAKVWDVKSGKELLTLQGHTTRLTSVAFSPDGELIATGSDDETLRLWEARTGRALLVLPSEIGPPEVVAFSPDGGSLAVGSYRASAVYRLTGRLWRHLSGHGFMTTSLAFHPRKPVLASASRDNDVTLWAIATGTELERWKGFPGMAGNLAFSPDGRLLAAAPFARIRTPFFPAGAVSLVETETGKVRKRFTGAHTAAVAFDPSGRRLALAEPGGAVSVCDVVSGEPVHRWQVTRGWIEDVAFVNDGTQLLIGELGGALRVWDVAGGRTLRQAILPRGLLRFAVDGAGRHVAAADVGSTVRILALPDLRVVATLESRAGLGWTALAFSGDGRWLAVGGEDRRVTIYDGRTFHKVLSLPPQDRLIYDVAFQPGGSGLAVGSGDERLTVWDLAQMEPALAGVGLGWDQPPGGSAGVPQGGPLARFPWGHSPGRRKGATPPEAMIWIAEQILETNPDQPEVCLQTAWVYVTGPKHLRDPLKALPLARRALELAPDEPLCLNTLGVVYYRLGWWQKAVETLQASARANRDGPTAYELFFLAMIYRQTGEPEKAKECYDRAVRWCRARSQLPPYQVAELRAIRAEADEVAAMLDTPGLPRGRFYADRGQWDKAAADYAEAFEREPPEDPFAWFEHAYLRLQVGDTEGYRKLCARMREQFGESTRADDVALLAHACVLAPDALGDAGSVLRLARQRFDRTPAPSAHHVWSVHVLGLACYRAGSYPEAVDCLTKGLKDSPDWDYQILNWLVLSMAHQRLGHGEEAREWLDKAEQAVAARDRERPAGSPFFAPPGWQWRDWLGVQMLRREVKGLR
jgi:WD40 repeat protein/serine/threonine protein kinase/tetratricopeptide (TPR) repeat protein